MTKKIIAPWLDMHDNSQRRINDSIHNIFWIKDDQGRYGLMLQFSDGFIMQMSDIKLQGLFTIIRKEEGIIELYLILKNSEDLELFNLLCGDLILSAFNCKRTDKLFNEIVNRLLRWQAFLSRSRSLSLSEPLQMGLFSELLILMDFLYPIFGITTALYSWTGPDQDKKDFSTDRSFVEVKSLLSSKGQSITISSLDQLDSASKPINLAVCNLSRSENGRSIEDIITSILELINLDETLELEFHNKLAKYGYMEGITEAPFYKWIVDRTVFYEVCNKFPKIIARSVASQIIDVKYRIDLSRCIEFEVPFTSLNL